MKVVRSYESFVEANACGRSYIVDNEYITFIGEPIDTNKTEVPVCLSRAINDLLRKHPLLLRDPQRYCEALQWIEGRSALIQYELRVRKDTPNHTIPLNDLWWCWDEAMHCSQRQYLELNYESGGLEFNCHTPAVQAAIWDVVNKPAKEWKLEDSMLVDVHMFFTHLIPYLWNYNLANQLLLEDATISFKLLEDGTRGGMLANFIGYKQIGGPLSYNQWYINGRQRDPASRFRPVFVTWNSRYVGANQE